MVTTEEARELSLRSRVAGLITEGYRSKVKAGDWYYAGPPDFVLQHGEFFEASPLPKPYPYRRYRSAKACFRNANKLAFAHDELTYVEGYAESEPGFTPLHAWCVNRDGRVIDPTWRNAAEKGVCYLGVRFPFEVVNRLTVKTEVFGSLIDCWEAGYPLLREPWNGSQS